MTTVCDENSNKSCRSSQNVSIPLLIAKKRDGHSYTEDEIKQLITAVCNKEMQDSQLGAFLMAIYLQGMSKDETVWLTKYMTESGDVFQWPEEWKTLMVDKHSTGGVGDKASLPLAPSLASLGVKVPMISGRGLGFTGGTLDKLESIAGYCVSQNSNTMKKILEEVGCCIVGQTDDLVPADRRMYTIRDVTSTTESIPLVAGSIISKKAAESLHGLVLDVKYGKGAFFKDYDKAKELAKTLVDVSNGVGVKTTAILSSMNSPLGNTVGNALEVGEAIQCLQGNGPASLEKVVSKLGGQLLYSIGIKPTQEEGEQSILKALHDGSALKKFHDMIISQGVDRELADKLCDSNNNPFKFLPQSNQQTTFKSKVTGYVNNIDALECAYISGSLGAGRTKAGQSLDLSVGLQLHVAVGQHIKEGESWITLHHNSNLTEVIMLKLENILSVKPEPPSVDEMQLIKEVIC